MSSGSNEATPIPPPLRKQSVASSGHGEDGGDYCRICRGDATPEQPLFYPCKCSGSIKFVHQDCLMEWLSHSQKKYCELCKTPFRFTKLYDQSMPDTVPLPLFLRQILLHSVKGIARWSRYTFVVFVWLCWLPWTIRQIWRGLFWVADGSWMSAQEMRQLIAAQSNKRFEFANAQQAVNVLLNTTTDGEMLSSNESTMYIDPLAELFNFLSPVRLLKGLLHLLWRTSQRSKRMGETSSSSTNSTFLSTPVLRQPSLLSDVKSIKAVTRYPVINNALIDILEGQLVCLLVIAAFILVFLIREWVINQQPILNMPDPDQAEQPIVHEEPAEQPEPPARRRRGLRRLADQNAPLDNRRLVFGQRPLAVPRPRRAATENNLALQNQEPTQIDRPAFPPRATSLVPPTQTADSTQPQPQAVRQTYAERVLTEGQEDVQPPPLQRGAFDEMAHVRRNIEEGFPPPPPSQEQTPTVTDQIFGDLVQRYPVSPEPATQRSDPFTFGSSTVPIDRGRDSPQNLFTFRASSQQSPEAMVNTESAQSVGLPKPHDSGDEEAWTSDSESGELLTPEESPVEGNEPVNELVVVDVHDDGTAEAVDVHDDFIDEEPQTLWANVSRWLWQTEDYNPTDASIETADNTELVQDAAAAAEAQFAPAGYLDRPIEAQNGPIPVPAPVPAPAREPNFQFGIDLNDPNAMDEAEDIEGILELIGMEGPIAGMIQNIIFSVFLITLTLSASIWCPYIWGKIALLFLANPVGVFIRAPLYLVSRTADLLIDVLLFVIGVSGFFVNHLTKVVKILSAPVLPRLSRFFDTDKIEELSLTLSQNSGNRLEKALSGTLFGLRPDLPTFSMQSHHAMRVFKKTLYGLGSASVHHVNGSILNVGEQLSLKTFFTMPVLVGTQLAKLPIRIASAYKTTSVWFHTLARDLKPVSFADEKSIDYTLIQWTTQEKIVCIILGYALFTLAGVAYLKLAHLFLGLKKDEKVDGFLADTLRQAGGVMKVIVIIGIEMIVFPLYCGIMLDLALLPLFEGATLLSRLSFLVNSPITAVFVHWFIGTCYMFHFALFVSMCRKIMRKGVLYFIRDPDDPSFHPVRDVLERPVATQLGKIAFSAFVYGGLLIVCLGGVVLGLSCIGNMLPIHWSAHEPRLAFPADVVFYNLMLPYILRRFELSGKIASMYEWWFRGCASGLRLTQFLFGQERKEERWPSTVSWAAMFDSLFGTANRKDSTPNMAEEARSSIEKVSTVEVLKVECSNDVLDDELIRRIYEVYGDIQSIQIDPSRKSALVQFTSTEALEQVPKAPSAIIRGDLSITASLITQKPEGEDLISKENFDGTFVRAPATDSVRIPKGTRVFLEVTEDNERIDGKVDSETGLHGKKDERFAKIYIPPHFKARIATFIVLVWIFAASTGILFSLGPLLVGRAALYYFANLDGPANDLYAFTIGIHICGAIIYVMVVALNRWEQGLKKAEEFTANTRQALPRILSVSKYTAGLIYMGLCFGVILPFTVSLLSELYVHMPLYGYLLNHRSASAIRSSFSWTSFSDERTKSTESSSSSTPTIYVLQTWTIGLLYLRLIIRIVLNYPNPNTRPATAVRGIVRNGTFNPDVRLATRAFILPVTIVSILLLVLPLVFAYVIGTVLSTTKLPDQAALYRHAYPTTLAIAAVSYGTFRIKERIESWRIKIRDEVYLIGERLHNFQDEDAKKKHPKKKSSMLVKSVQIEEMPREEASDNIDRDAAGIGERDDEFESHQANGSVSDKGKGKEVIREASTDVTNASIQKSELTQPTTSAEIGYSIQELRQQVEDMQRELDEMDTATTNAHQEH